MNWDRLENVVSQAHNRKGAGLLLPTVDYLTAIGVVEEFNALYPNERLYRQIDELQPEGWYHVTEDCMDYGLVTNKFGRYIIYTTAENNFTKFIKSKKLLYTVF